MSVPAVMALESGLGREAREWTGHNRNGNWELDEEGDPRPVGNNHSGIQGDIATDEPVYGKLTLHAPTSIPKK